MNKYLYHGTLLENWGSIKRQGLVPKQVEESNVWHFGSKIASICLVKDKNIAEMFALRKRYTTNKGTPIILKVENKFNSLEAEDYRLGLKYNVVLEKISPKNIVNFKKCKIKNVKMFKFFRI